MVSQKLKYARKSLSEQSAATTHFTVVDLFDTLSFSFDFTLSDTIFSSLLSSVLLGIPLSEVVPVVLDFEFTLPDPEEFARGLLISISRISLVDAFPELLTLSALLYGTLEREHASQVVGTQLTKGVYGVSRYGRSYYDPVAVREFFRSTLYALTKKRSTDETLRRRVEAASRALDVNEELVRYVFNALQIASYSRVYAASLDYAWFDVTMFPPEGSEPRVPFVGWDLVQQEADSVSVVDSAGTCWFDNCLFDTNFFAPEEAPTVYLPEREGTLLTEVSYYAYRRARSRLLFTGLALANYQTAEERLEPERSIRLEQYGTSRFLAEAVRAIARAAAGAAAASGFDLNLYAAAALDLAARLARPGGWGDEAFRAMTRDELRDYFVSRWAAQGLDAGVLDSVFRALYDSGLVQRYKHIREQTKELVGRARR